MLRFIPVIALLATAQLFAADFSGRWAGTMETNGSRVPIYLTLNYNGGTITGSVATGTNLKQVTIDNAEFRDDALVFEVQDNTNRLMRFRLTLTGGVLGGDATVGTQVSKVAVVPVGGGSGDRAPVPVFPPGGGSGPFRIGGGVSAPVLIHKVEPEYSEQARAAKYRGTVLLYVEVSPDGTPTNIRVQRSLGLGLDEKAVECVKQWRFKPGEKDGKPVTVAATIEVNFRL